MEPLSLWDIIKTVMNWLWVPLGAIMAYIFKDYIQHKNNVNNINDRVSKLELVDPRSIDKRVTTLEVKVGNIENSLIRIEVKVDKIMEHLLREHKE